MFIRFMNEVDGPVNRIYLEKLGISTKRDNDDTIGQFGSGSKFAPIAALRNGWRWICAGTDDDGDYLLEYVSESDGGFDHVFYQYSNEDGDMVVMKPSSFTVDAGLLSWTDDFQIFREAFANALDEHLAWGAKYSVDIVDEIEHVPGYFCVYVTASDNMREILDEFDRWFFLNHDMVDVFYNVGGQTELSWNGGRDPLRIYQKSILVYERDLQTAIFNYNIRDLTLNEERKVKDTWEINSYATMAIESIVDELLAIEFISADKWDNSEKVFELTLPTYHLNELRDKPKSVWNSAWYARYGIDAVPVPEGTPEQILKNIEYRNMVPVEVRSKFLYELLKRAEVINAEEILGHPLDLEIVEPTLMQKVMLNRAIGVVRKFDQRIDGIKEFHVFVPTKTQNPIRGLYRSTTESISLSTDVLSSLEEAVATIVHELDHHVSGLKDGTDAFRAIADQRIAQLMLMVDMMEGDNL